VRKVPPLFGKWKPTGVSDLSDCRDSGRQDDSVQLMYSYPFGDIRVSDAFQPGISGNYHRNDYDADALFCTEIHDIYKDALAYVKGKKGTIDWKEFSQFHRKSSYGLLSLDEEAIDKIFQGLENRLHGQLRTQRNAVPAIDEDEVLITTYLLSITEDTYVSATPPLGNEFEIITKENGQKTQHDKVVMHLWHLLMDYSNVLKSHTISWDIDFEKAGVPAKDIIADILKIPSSETGVLDYSYPSGPARVVPLRQSF